MRSRILPSSPARTPSSLRIREGRPDDAAAVEAVHFASREAVYAGRVADWPPPGPDRPGRIERWRQWLGDPGISCLVGEEGDRLVGFSTIRASSDAGADRRTAEMPTLYVHPDHWRRGHGRALCSAALDEAGSQGFSELTLWVLEINTDAAAFYEALGFTLDGATKVDALPSEHLVARRYRIELEPPSSAP